MNFFPLAQQHLYCINIGFFSRKLAGHMRLGSTMIKFCKFTIQARSNKFCLVKNTRLNLVVGILINDPF